MNRRILHLSLLLLVLVLAAACASAHVRQGDRLAKEGKLEEALAEYRAAEKKSSTNLLLKRIAKTEKRLAEEWVKKGLAARDAGHMGEAADWWKRAAELRPNDDKPGSARPVIAQNAGALETCGETALRNKKWEESFTCWEALQIAFPDRMDLQQKIEQAHRSFAADLDRDAQALAKKGLTGAALVLAMRARSHDPLQDGGFDREQSYRKQVASASLVNVGAVSLDDRGFWAMGAYTANALSQRLGEYPPYGPTLNPQALQAVFMVSVENFAWWDQTTHGVMRQPVQNPKSAGGGKVANPEHAAQKIVVEKLEKELKAMEIVAGKATPTPTPGASPWKVIEAPESAKDKNDKKDKKAAAAKPKETPKPDPKKMPAPRVPTDEEIAAKGKALEEAKAKLAALPEMVSADEAAAAQFLPWTEVTRYVQARVRFELREPDFTEPVVKTVTLHVDAKDRTHSGDALQLPSVEELVGDLAAKLAGSGTETLLEARNRRADRWIERGREARNKGSEDEALDMYVRALFARGIEGGNLPGDAATVVAVRLEKGSFRDIVAGP